MGAGSAEGWDLILPSAPPQLHRDQGTDRQGVEMKSAIDPLYASGQSTLTDPNKLAPRPSNRDICNASRQ